MPMVLVDKAIELYKTRLGKFLAVALALVVIFAFSNFAYGVDGENASTGEEANLADTGDENSGDDSLDDSLETSGENVFPEIPGNDVEENEESTDGTVITDTPEDEANAEDENIDAVDPEFAYIKFNLKDPANMTLDFDVPDGVEQTHDGEAVGDNEVIVTSGEEYSFRVTYESGYLAKPAEVTSTVLADTPDEETVPAREVAALTIDPADVPEATYSEQAKDIQLFTIPADAIQGNVVVTLSTDIREVAYTWDQVKDALEAGNDIRLGADIEIPEGAQGVMVCDNANTAAVTLDLYGNSIQNPKKVNVEDLFHIPSGITFTVKDSSGAGSAEHKSDPVGGYTVGSAIPEVGYSDGTLTYYKVLSTAGNGQTAETLYKCTIKYNLGGFTPLSEEDAKEADSTEVQNGDGLGSIICDNMDDLFYNQGTLNLEGVFLKSTGVDGGACGNAIYNKGALNLNGAHIVGCSVKSDYKGATMIASGAVTSLGGSVNVSGDSVIAANDSVGSGAGIYASSTSVSVKDAVIAANVATSYEFNGNNTQNWTEGGSGGGICIDKGSSLNVSGNAMIASNQANHFGGGIIGATGTSINVSGNNAYITANSTLFTPSFEQQGYLASRGGAGICSLGALTLDDCYITGNLSGDAGGGVMIPTSTGTLVMDGAIVASNYAKASEGGGLYCRTGEGSKIKSGYITNNRTDTEFDYGGGAIFVSNAGSTDRGKLLVYNPIVTDNTADGYGGGLAGCKNAMTVTNSAAIFNNNAKETQNTTNSNVELGDGWGKAVNDRVSQLKGSSQDYFCAGESWIYNQMLGGGEYDWTGYMTGDAAAAKGKGTATAVMSNSSVLKNNKVTFPDGSTQQGFYATLQKTIGNSVFSSDFNNDNEVRITVKNDLDFAKRIIEDFTGSKVTIKRTHNLSFTKSGLAYLAPEGMYGNKEVKADSDGYRYALETAGADTYYHIYFVVADIPSGGMLANGGHFVDGYNHSTYEGMNYMTSIPVKYNNSTNNAGIFSISEDGFPKDIASEPVAHLQSGLFGQYLGIVALTANPTDDEISAAYNAARFNLFITGNYSHANGGGIAVNGEVTVGNDPRKPENPDDKPQSKVGSLTLTKTINASEYTETAGDVTVVFNVAGYENKASYEDGSVAPIYENVVTMTFTADELKDKSQSVTKAWVLKNLKRGWFFVIEEVTGNGNFDFSGAEGTNATVTNAHVEVLINVDNPNDYEADHDVSVTFTNMFKDKETYSTNAVNRYSGSDGAYSWQRIPGNDASREIDYTTGSATENAPADEQE